MPQQSEHEIEVFNAALELPAAERAAYLDRVCANDLALRRPRIRLSTAVRQQPVEGISEKLILLISNELHSTANFFVRFGAFHAY